jgi:hypothetical protein
MVGDATQADARAPSGSLAVASERGGVGLLDNMVAVGAHVALGGMLNLHVKFGTPLRVPERAEFDGLIAGGRRPIAEAWVR